MTSSEGNCLPTTQNEWRKWIAEQEARTLRVFNDDPDRLIADFRREKQISRGYQGRELLELLQNANDAALEAGIKGKVRIELRSEGLIVANTGAPFTTDGVKSLRITDLSPKVRKKSRLIGQKGLGFRSVLNWSRQPFITSGSLKLAFTETKLRTLCAELERSNAQIASLIAFERRHPDDIVLPSLPFPHCLVDGLDEFQNLPSHHLVIIGRCEELRRTYDTVIGMPFIESSILAIAQKELGELTPEVLLFTNGLECISVSPAIGVEEEWSIGGGKIRELTINGSLVEKHKYATFQDHGDIPPELLEGEISSEYEVLVAVPQGDTPVKTQTLFSFFPTNVAFPFPAVCHATVELDSNRKYPVEGELNRFIFSKLAELLSMAAEGTNSESDRWLRASIVARQQDYDSSLVRAEFGRKLLKSVSDRRIIPLVHGGYAKPDEVTRIAARNLHWLPREGFEDVALPVVSNILLLLLNELNVGSLAPSSLRERLNAVPFVSLSDRVSVVAGLISEGVTPNEPAPNLLIDKSGNVIPSNERIYFSPDKDQKEYTRPSWLKLHFLDEEFRHDLAEALGVRERRDLRQKLEPYGVQEYSLANVASALAVDARKQMESDQAKKAQYQQDMLIALFLLFPDEGDVPKLPETTAVPLLTKSEVYADSRRLYLSEKYAGTGNLLSVLFRQSPDVLVTDPDTMGLDGQSSRTIAFLSWLGVASWPREIAVGEVEAEFLKYVLDNSTYPMKYERHIRASQAEFYRPRLKNVVSIDRLQEILTGDPAAVLTWLALDVRAQKWTTSRDGNGELWDNPYNSRYEYQFSKQMPSYVRWKIQNTAWLPALGVSHAKPMQCMLGERGLEKLLPPPTEFFHDLFVRYKINSRLKRNALEIAGVTPDISHLEPEQIYELISAMPKVDPSGKHARNFYRTLLERIDTDMRIWPEVSQSFLHSASMWGRGPSGEKYYPVRQLVHADSEDFPELLCQRMTIADLPKRAGALKVRRLFGIEPIDRKKINQRILRSVEIPETADIQVQFQRAKPFLFYLRNVRSKQLSDLAQLQSLQIVLCSTIEVDIEYEELKIPALLDQHLQWILEENVAYLLYSETTRPSLGSDLLADTIGAVLASIFNLAQGSDFARIIRCAENERLALLKRIVGESEIPHLTEIAAQFDQALRGFSFKISEVDGQPEAVRPSSGEEQGGEARSNEPVPTIDNGKGTVSTTPRDHKPVPPPKKIGLVVRSAGRRLPGGQRGGLTKVVDGDVCEKRALQFEELQSRFPLKVSRDTGHKGPRCDLLSFASEADRASFEAQPSGQERDPSTVVRFIEVKGRSHENSPISLKGNELEAARTYGNQYFLYRLYMESADKYVMLVLQDPLNHPEAIEDVKDVYVNRANVEGFNIDIIREAESD